MIKYYKELLSRLEVMNLPEVASMVVKRLDAMFNTAPHGDFQKRLIALNALPDISTKHLKLNTNCIEIGKKEDLSTFQFAEMRSNLLRLQPWRKGPIDLFGIHIETEWRSDVKWLRIKDYLTDLTHRNVLDIGCGCGYHAYRMAGAGAKFVLGIDPFDLFVMQSIVLKKYCPDMPVWIAPLRIEDMPLDMAFFDTVFSMGVLYHRPSPIDHLLQLKSLVRSGGEVVLETIVVDGPLGYSLVPKGRYAKMRNIWFLPSTLTLENWLGKVGFKNIRLVDVSLTTLKEQRQTDWMTFESLNHYLDPVDSSKTIEGYPAPKRAVFICNS